MLDTEALSRAETDADATLIVALARGLGDVDMLALTLIEIPRVTDPRLVEVMQGVAESQTEAPALPL